MALDSAANVRRRGRYLLKTGLVADFPILQLTAPVRDLSRGGFAIASPAPFQVDHQHQVVLRCAAESTPTVAVRVVHARPDDQPETFVVGFQFLDADRPRLRAAVTTIVRSLELLDEATST